MSVPQPYAKTEGDTADVSTRDVLVKTYVCFHCTTAAPSRKGYPRIEHGNDRTSQVITALVHNFESKRTWLAEDSHEIEVLIHVNALRTHTHQAKRHGGHQSCGDSLNGQPFKSVV